MKIRNKEVSRRLSHPNHKITVKDQTRKALLNGKAKYDGPPCTKKFRSATFYFKNIIYLCYEASYCNKEVNCTEPSPSVVFLD